MKKTNMTSEIREYTMNADNPIVIPRNLLEEAGINPYADINIYLQNGSILIPVSYTHLQQMFLKELAKKMLSTESIIKNLPSLISVMYNEVTTDFTLTDCVKYAGCLLYTSIQQTQPLYSFRCHFHLYQRLLYMYRHFENLDEMLLFHLHCQYRMCR